MKIALLTAESPSGEQGGAERFYEGLAAALREEGGDVDSIALPADESSFDQIRENYERCRGLDLSAFDLVISTKSPTYAVSHANHVAYLVHTTRVFYDMFEETFPDPSQELLEQRRDVLDWDHEAMLAARRHFCIGHEVARRLREFNGIDSEVLHPPLRLEGLEPGEWGDYFLLPGRLHAWKRVDLVIRAVLASKLPLRLVIAGTGETEPELRSLAKRNTRIEFLGRVSDTELAKLYRSALAVPFVPLREDYGYVTLEAFASAKAVITCSDSGEPLEFVRNDVSGLVTLPTVDGVRAALECLYEDRELAKALGMRARLSLPDLNWRHVARRLLQAGSGTEVASAIESPEIRKSTDKTKVAIIDMQPIDPPVGGGRLRILGLYHALGQNIEARYVGSYDWPGEAYRRHMVSPTLEEIDIPLSDAHHAAAANLSAQANGKTVIDIAFPTHVLLSPAYLRDAKDALAWADVVVFSHPWAFPALKPFLRQTQVVVYESHNVEGYLRYLLLDETNPVEAHLLRDVVRSEWSVGSRADLILACSDEDLGTFMRIYGWSAEKMRVVPNGVMAERIVPASEIQRARLKSALGLNPARKAAIFIGSAYEPNVAAASFIVEDLAPRLPEYDFIVAGEAGSGLTRGNLNNVLLPGRLSDEQRLAWLQASDFAVNPMFSGSGTNIKMFDFMAAGLPVVSTEIGARGIRTHGRDPIVLAESTVEGFGEAIRRMTANADGMARRGAEARACVELDYSWEAISPKLGHLLQRQTQARSKRPYFSVVIPTLDRHAKLEQAIECLGRQSHRDFEVVVIDQTEEPWPRRSEDFGFPLFYYQSTVKGAARARNTGVFLAQGQVIAFTDDDCLPESDWLKNASTYFLDKKVHAIEGLILSDRQFDPEFRYVSNADFEGFGFMTANLFVRAATFRLLDGFDLAFDRPSFREDTDLGWRILEIGPAPFARDVRVLHPAVSRNSERESHSERVQYFEKDALLFRKHPQKYRELFEFEGHWNKTEGFWEHFAAGAQRYNVDISEFDDYRKVSFVRAASGTKHQSSSGAK